MASAFRRYELIAEIRELRAEKMPLLDRFRSVPAHKNPDAEARLAYVEGLSIDERDLLVSIAREDENPRIRRAAVAKLMDPPTLAAVSRDDADAAVRAQAAAMLRDIALEAFEETGEAEALAAVDALADLKMIAHVAKTSTRPAVAERALTRVGDPKTHVSLACHAALETVRRAALDTLVERHDVIAVAMHADFKDTAMSAVDRLSERADLEQVAERSANKSALKRARGVLREMDDRAAAEAAEEARLRAEIAEEQRQAEEAETTRRREATELDRIQAAEARARSEADAARAREEQLAAERMSAESHAAAEAAKAAAEQRERLLQLVGQLETAAADSDLVSAIRRRASLDREWHRTAVSGLDDDLKQRYVEADARLRAREEEAREADRRTRRASLEKMQDFVRGIEEIAGRADVSAKAAERAVRDARAALGNLPPLPSKADYDDVVRRLKAVQAALAPKLQELREIEGWQRWANIGIQEQLCEKMEALKTASNPEEIAARVRDLQRQWRQAADVPSAERERLWQRFKAAHDEVWSRCQSYFAEDAGRRAESLQKKVALCERAEALSDSTRWIQTADEIKAMQQEWKTIGPVSRGQEKAVWERFRVACDRFFTRRHEDLAQRKAVWTDNLAKKDALCARVEALVDSTDWDAAAAEIKRLQAEWKTIGPVKKTRSEAIWLRFRAACDAFFARYAQRHEIARGERLAAREAICAELESLVATPSASDGDVSASPAEGAPAPDATADVVAKVRALRGRWHHEIAQRGVEPARAAELDSRFASAFNRVLAAFPQAFADTDLDPDANRRRMEALVAQVEKLAESVRGPAAMDNTAMSPTRLAAMLKDALAANTIGGKVDQETRLRAVGEDLRQAQASWSRIGPVPDPVRRPLADRFARAVRLITDTVSGAAGTSGAARPSTGSGGSGRAAGPSRSGASGPSGGTGRLPV